MKNFLGLFAIGGLLLARAPIAYSADPQERLRQHVEDYNGGTRVIAVVLENEGSERRVFTYPESATDPGWVFEIGSITKVFTSVLLADMVERGEVRLDSTLGELLPGEPLPSDVASISLRELSQHTSGLPRLPMNIGMLLRLFMQGDDPYVGTTTRGLFSTLQKMKPVGRGEFAYSNLGTAVLGQVLAVVAGKPYEQLLRERVLEPAGFYELWPDIHAAPSARVIPGHGANGLETPHWHIDAYAPAGSMLASARGLADFVAWQMSAPAAAWRFSVNENAQPETLGWMKDDIGGHEVIWHNGGTGGFRSFAGFVPATGRGVVVLSDGAVNVDHLALQLLDVNSKMPPPQPRTFWAWYTLGAISIPPLAMLGCWWRHRRQKKAGAEHTSVFRNRWQFLSVIAGHAFILALAYSIGAWEIVPISVAWLSLVVTVAFTLPLLPVVRSLEWRGNVSGWRVAMSALATVFYGGLAALSIY